jgi:salicylate hydroxylase
MYCASLAVEDAAVLGTLFSRLREWEQVPLFLQAYQELRQPRCNAVHLSELSHAALTWLPPGPERDLRNAQMRQSMQSKEHWDDKRLRQQWDEISETFGYSAREAAEAWWVNWGVLEESTKEVQVYEPLDLTFEMTEVTASGFLMPESSNTVMV